MIITVEQEHFGKIKEVKYTIFIHVSSYCYEDEGPSVTVTAFESGKLNEDGSPIKYSVNKPKFSEAMDTLINELRHK